MLCHCAGRLLAPYRSGRVDYRSWRTACPGRAPRVGQARAPGRPRCPRSPTGGGAGCTSALRVFGAGPMWRTVYRLGGPLVGRPSVGYGSGGNAERPGSVSRVAGAGFVCGARADHGVGSMTGRVPASTGGSPPVARPAGSLFIALASLLSIRPGFPIERASSGSFFAPKPGRR